MNSILICKNLKVNPELLFNDRNQSIFILHLSFKQIYTRWNRPCIVVISLYRLHLQGEFVVPPPPERGSCCFFILQHNESNSPFQGVGGKNEFKRSYSSTQTTQLHQVNARAAFHKYF